MEKIIRNKYARYFSLMENVSFDQYLILKRMEQDELNQLTKPIIMNYTSTTAFKIAAILTASIILIGIIAAFVNLL